MGVYSNYLKLTFTYPLNSALYRILAILYIKIEKKEVMEMDEELNSWKEVYRAYGCRTSFEDAGHEM